MKNNILENFNVIFYLQNNEFVNSYIYLELEKDNRHVTVFFKSKKGKIKVLVNMFGRETPVELDFLQINKI